MYIAQNCFGLSDESVEDAIYESQAIRRFRAECAALATNWRIYVRSSMSTASDYAPCGQSRTSIPVPAFQLARSALPAANRPLTRCFLKNLVGARGFEPATLCSKRISSDSLWTG